ncbi:hypothetical protein HDE_09870 [Halotydeus destructor]|nr:hypothetical protein HDE_09870 [Halotydeus destructor]
MGAAKVATTEPTLIAQESGPNRVRLNPNARLFVNMMRNQIDMFSRRARGTSGGRAATPQPPTIIVQQVVATTPKPVAPSCNMCYTKPETTTKGPKRFIATGYIVHGAGQVGLPLTIPQSPVMFGR